MQIRVLFSLCLIPMCGALALTSDDSLTFEVASVKPHPPSAGGPAGSSFKGGPGTDDPGRITVINRMLSTLIIEAYGIRAMQLERPEWVAESRYDIVANVPPGATPAQAKAMMRNLLEQRFDLKIRREMKDLAVYEMVIGKDGLKMKPSDETRPASGPVAFDKLKTGGDGFPELPPSAQTILEYFTPEGAKVMCQRESMSKIVSWLSERADRPIINKTGLQGTYDFSMTWNPDQNDAGQDYGLLAATEKQLGLKLEPEKTPVEMLIVVSALRVPKEN